MYKFYISILLSLLLFAKVEASELESFKIPRTQIIPIQDTQSERQYELYVKLPAGYKENKDSDYPVIFFTDADWHIEILSASTEYLMEEAILVGISWQKDIKEELVNDVGVHVSRFRDFTLRKSDDPEIQTKYQLGQASIFLEFIRNEVIEYIENNYRTDPGRRTYFGYSLGGKFGAYTLLKQPDTFKNYILGSPELESEISLLSELESRTALKDKGLSANVFISYGSLEKDLAKYAQEFITMLKNRNDKSLSLKNVVIKGDHQAAFPMTGVRSVTWLSGLKN